MGGGSSHLQDRLLAALGQNERQASLEFLCWFSECTSRMTPPLPRPHLLPVRNSQPTGWFWQPKNIWALRPWQISHSRPGTDYVCTLCHSFHGPLADEDPVTSSVFMDVATTVGPIKVLHLLRGHLVHDPFSLTTFPIHELGSLFLHPFSLCHACCGRQIFLWLHQWCGSRDMRLNPAVQGQGNGHSFLALVTDNSTLNSDSSPRNLWWPGSISGLSLFLQ